ncbi:SMI1/KNR4 family protein [Streptodolium elevatio]|uniref:SMI1/KNR4 family protein n=1 Tax=Streptodolium elevatio TaxID=3157996 RepID=A0ABV3DQY2_9ACTN
MVESNPDLVTASWSRIDAWLVAHAPASLARLGPPADPAAVAAAERVLGVELPAELAASLACHDGIEPECRVFPEMDLLSVAGVVDQWELRNQVEAELFDDEEDLPPLEGDPYWHRLWIPVGHFQGDLNVIDLRPGPGQGRMGWVSHDGSSSFAGEELGTLGTYLAALADTLTTGRQPIPGLWEEPCVSPDGELSWWGVPRGGVGWSPAPVGLPGVGQADGARAGDGPAE